MRTSTDPMKLSASGVAERSAKQDRGRIWRDQANALPRQHNIYGHNHAAGDAARDILLACCKFRASGHLPLDSRHVSQSASIAPALLDIAREEAVLPHLARGLMSLGAQRDEEPMRSLLPCWYASLAGVMTLCDASRKLRQVLEEAGIPAIQLKGPVLAEQIYGDACDRMCADIDMLAHQAHIAAILDILGKQGYRIEGGDAGLQGECTLYNQVILRRGNISVDLHWLPLGDRYGRERAEMLNTLIWESAELSPEGYLQPSPSVFLVYLALHLFCHHKSLRLADITDAAVFIRKYQSDDFWLDVYVHTVTLNAAVPVALLLQSVQTQLGIPAPEALVQCLKPSTLSNALLAYSARLTREKNEDSGILDVLRGMACLGVCKGVVGYIAWRLAKARSKRRSALTDSMLHPCSPSLPRLPWDISRRWRVIKRVGDLVGSILLLAVSAPFFPLIAMAIKISSRGPVFFRQERIGCDGVPFVMWKFRTLGAEVDTYLQKNEIAPSSIPWVGRLLRRTAIDEIPQLLNVLKGEMSLVGPRPEMPFIVAQYSPLERVRLAVKPGITGLWQLFGDHHAPICHHLGLDLRYIAYSSPLLDTWLLIRTGAFLLESVVVRLNG